MDTHPIIRMSIEVLLQKQWIADCPENGWLSHNHRLSPNPSCWFNHYGYRLARNRRFYLPERIKQIQSTVKVLFYHRNQNAFMLAERYKLVLTVLSVNAMIRMIFSCRSDDPLRIHVFPSETLNYIKAINVVRIVQRSLCYLIVKWPYYVIWLADYLIKKLPISYYLAIKQLVRINLIFMAS